MPNTDTGSSVPGLFRLAVATPEVHIGDPDANANEAIGLIAEASKAGAGGILFPELSLTGYSCADLFYQRTLREGAIAGLRALAEATADTAIFAVVGLPLEIGGRLYNTAALLAGGRIVGVVPKQFLPTTNEFYEERWFARGGDLELGEIEIAGEIVPVGPSLVFPCENVPGLVLGLEICEDLWAVNPPSGDLALGGATLILNPSASDEMVGKAAYRRDLIRNQSARCLAAYAYASSGVTESTTDVVYSGHMVVAESGRVLAEGERFVFEGQLIVSDIDLDLLVHERLRNSSFSAALPTVPQEEVSFALAAEVPMNTDLRRPLDPHPFVPSDPARLDENAREVFTIQSAGLARRLRHIGLKNVTIGISGGLDSTLAVLVAVRAFDILGLDREGIVAITMPGPGTTDRTLGNAEKLIDLLGLTKRVIPIAESVELHLKDIGHPADQHDVTFENAQARERTQILMDVANQVGGLVVGTGDLSEAALGWCTFNGDHMSMYHVNAGVPKTLVRFLIRWAAASLFEGEASEVMLDVVDTPITPELLPKNEQGELQQKTEDTIGPYELHDFFLYQIVRHGQSPTKVFALARHAFAEAYDAETLLKWLRKFYWRFFGNQFKRSSMPDGPKVGSVALSPRGDWRMPSDATVKAWIKELDNI